MRAVGAIDAVAIMALMMTTACGPPKTGQPEAATIAMARSDGEAGWWTVTAVDGEGLSRPLEPEEPTTTPVDLVLPADLLFFATDSADIGPDGQQLLQTIARRLIDAGIPVVVVGHTDDRGGERHNLELGAARAEAVTRALVGLGVPSGLLRGPVSLGEACPVAANTDPGGRARNRRVELIVVNELDVDAVPPASVPAVSCRQRSYESEPL